MNIINNKSIVLKLIWSSLKLNFCKKISRRDTKNISNENTIQYSKIYKIYGSSDNRKKEQIDTS